MQDQIWQFGGSLAAILALVAVAWTLKLGPQPRLESEDDARSAADQAYNGFEPCDIAIDHRGAGAIMRDRAGATLVLKPHGSHFAGRLLGPAATAKVNCETNPPTVAIFSGEKRFGHVTFAIEDAQLWASWINAIAKSSDA